MVPFHQIKPQLIKYEWVNLSVSDREGALHLLAEQGYRVEVGGEDVVAILS